MCLFNYLFFGPPPLLPPGAFCPPGPPELLPLLEPEGLFPVSTTPGPSPLSLLCPLGLVSIIGALCMGAGLLIVRLGGMGLGLIYGLKYLLCTGAYGL